MCADGNSKIQCKCFYGRTALLEDSHLNMWMRIMGRAPVSFTDSKAIESFAVSPCITSQSLVRAQCKLIPACSKPWHINPRVDSIAGVSDVSMSCLGEVPCKYSTVSRVTPRIMKGADMLSMLQSTPCKAHYKAEFLQ